MEKQDILNFCKKNGFFLDKNVLNLFINLKKQELLKIINKLKEKGFSNNILTKEIFNKYNININNNETNIKILNNIKKNSGKIEIKDFINYFRDRFEKLKDILMNKNFEKLISIRKIGSNNGVFWVIGMIYNKTTTKNNNLLIEIEDLTGNIVILINRENKKLFEMAQNLLLDDIVAFKCSGSSKMLFVNDLVLPDAYLNIEKYGKNNNMIAFGGDFHIGSKYFLEKNLIKFIKWLNGEIGDERQKNLAKKIKYFVLVGNNIDGINIYPKQKKFLKISGCRNQYKELYFILNKIRKDIEIIICPGKHDVVWVGEPQSIISEKWACDLNKMDNVKLISNPSLIKIEGLKILFYNSGNLKEFINEIPKLRQSKMNSIKAVKEILKRRHFPSVYGNMNILLNKDRDDLVLDEIPDIFVIGGQNKVEIGNYNNILIISTSSWKDNNELEYKNKQYLCKIPILDLKSKKIKILDFNNNEIKLNNEKI